jgi:hypothetical protein
MDDEFKHKIVAGLDRIEQRLARLEKGQRELKVANARSLRRRWLRPPMWTFEQYSPRPISLAALPSPPALPADAPRIAIVTPSYNHARFLDATIDSVLAQNYPKLHYHVQDGGSVDGSIELLRSRRSHQLAQRTGQRAIPRD